MAIYLVTAQHECTCGAIAATNSVEILRGYWDKQKAEAYLKDMLLAAGKRGVVLDVEDLEMIHG